MHKWHMDKERENMWSTKSDKSPVTEKIDDQDQFTSNDPNGIQYHALYSDVTAANRQQYFDMAGRFLQVSSSGNQDMLIL